MQTSTGEQDAARWLDAEDAMMRQVLAWGMGHDRAAALRLAAALGPWWILRGRLPSAYPLLAELAGYAEPGGDRWCTAQFWAGWAARFSSDLAGALRHFTALRDAAGPGPSRALADALTGRAAALLELGKIPQGAEDARRSLALAREVGYPPGEVLALVMLAGAAAGAGDAGEAVRLARQADQVPGDIPPVMARSWPIPQASTWRMAASSASSQRAASCSPVRVCTPAAACSATPSAHPASAAAA